MKEKSIVEGCENNKTNILIIDDHLFQVILIFVIGIE